MSGPEGQPPTSTASRLRRMRGTLLCALTCTAPQPHARAPPAKPLVVFETQKLRIEGPRPSVCRQGARRMKSIVSLTRAIPYPLGTGGLGTGGLGTGGLRPAHASHAAPHKARAPSGQHASAAFHPRRAVLPGC